jgi:hypothetical protein
MKFGRLGKTGTANNPLKRAVVATNGCKQMAAAGTLQAGI